MKRQTSVAARLAGVAVILWCICAPSSALIVVVPGSDPVENLGWPLGADKVANLPGRLGYIVGPPFGGGEFSFYYRCKDTAAFNEALKTFAAIRTPRLEVVVRDGPKPDHFLRDEAKPAKENVRVDWTFTVWQPERWHRLRNDPRLILSPLGPRFGEPVPPPRIDVYVGAGPIDWGQVKVPGNVRVSDQREAAAAVKPLGGGLICGSVYDMATGQAIAGAEIALAQYDGQRDWQERPELPRGTTDTLGSAEIRTIPAGDYLIRVRAKGYASRGLGRYFNKANTYHEFAVELAREAVVKGVVTDPAGKPIPGAQVRASGTLGIDGRGYDSIDSQPATTDAQGRFEVRSLPRGYTLLWCSAPALCQVTPITEIHELPSDDGRIVMGKTGSIRGKVVRKDGLPLEGELHVYVRPPRPLRFGQWSGSAQCQPDGTFELKGVPPGQYWVSASTELIAGGKDFDGVLVNVKEGEVVEVKLAH